ALALIGAPGPDSGALSATLALRADSQRFDPRRQGCGLQPEQLSRAGGSRHPAVRGLQGRPDVVRFELADLGVGPHAVSALEPFFGDMDGTGRGRKSKTPLTN